VGGGSNPGSVVGLFVVWMSKGRTLTTRPGINLDTYLVPLETVPFSSLRFLACSPVWSPLSLSLALSLGGFARFLLRFHLRLTRISALVDYSFFVDFFLVFFGFVYYLFRNFSS